MLFTSSAIEINELNKDPKAFFASYDCVAYYVQTAYKSQTAEDRLFTLQLLSAQTDTWLSSEEVVCANRLLVYLMATYVGCFRLQDSDLLLEQFPEFPPDPLPEAEAVRLVDALVPRIGKNMDTIMGGPVYMGAPLSAHALKHRLSYVFFVGRYLEWRDAQRHVDVTPQAVVISAMAPVEE